MRRLLDNMKRLQKATGKKFNRMLLDALNAYVDKEIRLVQSRLDTFQDPLHSTLDKLHTRYVSPNPERHPDWIVCLKANNLYNEAAIQYSISKGWRVSER